MAEIYSEPKSASASVSIPERGRFILSTGPVDEVQQREYIADLRFNLAVLEMTENFPQLLPHLGELLVDPRI